MSKQGARHAPRKDCGPDHGLFDHHPLPDDAQFYQVPQRPNRDQWLYYILAVDTHFGRVLVSGDDLIVLADWPPGTEKVAADVVPLQIRNLLIKAAQEAKVGFF